MTGPGRDVQGPPDPDRPDDEAYVAARLRAAAWDYEPDRDRVWGRIADTVDAEADRGHRSRRYVLPIAVAASAALVVTGVNVFGGQGGPDGGTVLAGTPSGGGVTTVSGSASGVPSGSASGVAPSAAGTGSRRPSASPSTGRGGQASGSASSSVSSGSPSAGSGASAGTGTPSGPGAPSATAGGASGVAISIAPAPAGTVVTLAAGRPWMVAASGAKGGGVSGGFGVGPLQVNGTSAVRSDSPFAVSWQGGSPVAAGSAVRTWVVLEPGGGSVESLRIPLRPQGAPGTFTVYVATLGAGGLRAVAGGLGGEASAPVGGCGAAVCPVAVTVTVSGKARVDGTLDLFPTGGGSIGVAAARQE